MDIKIQGENITVPSGTAAARKDFRITLDSEYTYARGYYAIQNTGGGLTTQWKLGIKDDSRTYVDLVNGKHFQSDTNIIIPHRFNPQPLKAAGRTITVTLETYETTTSDLSIDMLFELHKGEMPACPPGAIHEVKH